MNKTETAKVLGYLKFTYINSFSKMDEDEKNAMVSVWQKHFEKDDFNKVMQAVEKICLTSRYVPTVAEIKDAMFDVSGIKQLDVGKAWEIVIKNARNDRGQAKANFDKLPANIQNALGSYMLLNEIGLSNPKDTSYIRSSFEKRYNEIIEHEKKDLASGYLTVEQVHMNNTLPAPKEENSVFKKLDFKQLLE